MPFSIIILHVPVKSIRYPHGLSNRTLFLLLFLSHTDNKCINFWIFFFHMFVQHMTPLPKTFREFRMFSCNSLIHLPTMRLKMCCNCLLYTSTNYQHQHCYKNHMRSSFLEPLKYNFVYLQKNAKKRNFCCVNNKSLAI